MTSPTISSPLPTSPNRSAGIGPQRKHALLFLTGLWLVIFFSALFAPPLLDDADATHANAARHMVTTGDMVTLTVNGIRYLEKAPLPYWLDAISFRIFGFNTFAAHLPQAIGVLLLALLGYHWSFRTWGARTAFYTGLGILTSIGVFLFTRVYIPEVLLSLFLAGALYCMMRALDEGNRSSKFYAYGIWVALALGVLTKGLVVLVFFGGTAIVYLALTGGYRQWRALKPFSGLALFLLIAAPWHILAGLRNTGGMNGHGFFWFYFVNEHFLRFLGKRYPKDYNKLPGYLFWSLHLVWLFPWSLFAPVAVIQAWRKRGRFNAPDAASRSALLLGIYAWLVLVFFSISTNQEYYTFPAYLAMLALMAAALNRAELRYEEDANLRRWIVVAHGIFAVIGVAAAIALGYGLWSSRALPFVPDIGELLAHRGVGDYTLSMSHFFDLTGPSFAALRLPAALAAITLAFGPAIAWLLRSRQRHLASTTAIALTSTVFLVAAHIALIRFAPMLSSSSFADRIIELENDHAVGTDSKIMLYGDQSYGSSIAFYLGRMVYLVDGRSTSMLFGSTFPDAPPIFLTGEDLVHQWGTGTRKILFVPLEKRDDVDRLLGNNKIVLKEASGKALFTDRPLDR
ncbi:MAG: glycosyltransferase family 39 protein [Edaphobacter sp.]|uniref:ArnT family glycosyltransferase n=1 Tax=Edaphobacter sp. TaxID=1934404 RepID=UPI0023849E7D|nr:glycosyltransferase family 39 protein [Edaphobacter sp.]MDE1176191.1 glycosyltransferase family 39 protein [Edaphobacter sp.]